MKRIPIPIVFENDACDLEYCSKEASGADVKANLTSDVILSPGESALVPTGIKMEIPKGYEIQVRPRSGLALKHQITVLNTPGTIDSDYRGEIKVLLINHGKESFTIKPLMRIAQLVLTPVCQAEFITGVHLAESERADGGFGHTGV